MFFFLLKEDQDIERIDREIERIDERLDRIGTRYPYRDEELEDLR